MEYRAYSLLRLSVIINTIIIVLSDQYKMYLKCNIHGEENVLKQAIPHVGKTVALEWAGTCTFCTCRFVNKQ